jgi:CysZ protein
VSESSAPATNKRHVIAAGEGFLIPLDGLGYMMEHRDLWRYAVLPFVFNLLITLVLLGLLILGLYGFHSWWQPPWVSGWVAAVAEVLVGILLAVVSLGLALIAWVVLQAVLCGFFYEKLAAAVERRLGVGEDEIREVPFWLGLLDVLRDLTFLVLMLIIVALLPFVPIVGLLIAPVVALYVQTVVIGREFLGFSLSLRGARWKQKRRFIKRHRAHTVGLGAACLFLALTPIVGAALLSPAVAGAVILHRRLAAADERAGWSWREP